MEMLVTGEPIDAQAALAWGLVNRVVPAAELDAAIRHFVDRILARSASVIALGKRAFYAQMDRTLPEAYALTSEAMTCNLADPDAAEGIDAFLEKRAPEWNRRS
jgi:enoyl-CoA hydratase/carnithine racemase